MICEKCGKPIPNGYHYCPACKLAEDPEYLKYKESINNSQNITKVQSPNVTSLVNGKNITYIKPTTEPIVQNEVFVKCQCGQKLEPGWKFCPQCKIPITVEISSNVENKEETTKENVGIYVAIFFSCIILSFIIRKYNYFFYVFALGTLVTALIKYPNSKAIKTLFAAISGMLVLYILAIVFLIASCASAASSCVG